MNEPDPHGAAPEDAGAADEPPMSDAVDEGDPELDDLATAFATVDAALQALDADDLDTAEALAASLGADGGVHAPDDVPTSSED